MLVILSVSLASGQPEDGKLLKFEPNDTLEEIRAKIEHNGYSFTVDNNWVYDMPPEMKRGFRGRYAPLVPAGMSDDIGPLEKHLGKTALPAGFDWRNYGGHSYIGPVVSQGNCGSCYAFGACAAAEGTYNFANGLYDANCADFSEAFIAFCLSDYYTAFDGCNGSDYDYMELQALVDYGVCDASAYPYSDYEQSCQQSAWNAPRVQFNSWHRVPCNDIDAIKTAIMTYGVVDAAVLITPAFEAYSGGIYQDTNTTCWENPCYYTPTDHAISLVGWDDNPPGGGGGVWILRNSWGTSWGESGYMRIRYTSAYVACEVCYLEGPSAMPTPTPLPNYIKLTASPATASPGSPVTLSWSCDFSRWNYEGVPVNIYLAAIRGPNVVDAPSSVSDTLSGEAVYLWGRNMGSVYLYSGSLQEPTYSKVSFPPVKLSNSIDIATPIDPSFAGDYVFATAFIRSDGTGFVRNDGMPVENSNKFTIQ